MMILKEKSDRYNIDLHIINIFNEDRTRRWETIEKKINNCWLTDQSFFVFFCCFYYSKDIFFLIIQFSTANRFFGYVFFLHQSHENVCKMSIICLFSPSVFFFIHCKWKKSYLLQTKEIEIEREREKETNKKEWEIFLDIKKKQFLFFLNSLFDLISIMTKQRRTFFVDDILHMVMPNESNELKRKRSISSDERDKIEDIDKLTKKKLRYEQSDYAQVIDIMNDDDEDDDESTVSNDSNGKTESDSRF